MTNWRENPAKTFVNRKRLNKRVRALLVISRREMVLLKKSICALFILLPALAVAQRLPEGVVPQHYSVTITPDLQKATFSGEETIQVQVLKPASAVMLNAAELQFQEASIVQGEQTQAAQAAMDADKEQATLTVAAQLVPGPASIRIKFTGILNDKLRGFYLAHSKSRNYAVTQFESTDARRAFPSLDEPALKATFSITLIVDKTDTAISNGHIVSDTPGPGEEKHTITFSTTPKMSTYLVALAVGDFECIEGAADNIPIRVCGTPDKKLMFPAALRYASEILKYYNQYYGIPYPFGKLDIVGAPDFEAGAMENTAAIFYRESLLFIDDKNSSIAAHQAVFEVLAHEMAHQWFGDLVTMKWWDNLWLNEGFATWMALKPSQALHPEWNATLDAVGATNGALQFDSLKNTHPIRAKADTPEAINELFDTISYEKGAAVLRMVEAYVSPDVFRRGVNTYLRKFSYNNATAEDFWQTITQTSGRPVSQIMPTFIDQAGEPLITVKAECVGPPPQPVSKSRGKKSRRKPTPLPPKTQVTVSQQRFFADPSISNNAEAKEMWSVPICIKSTASKPFCQIFSQRRQTVPFTGCSPWVFTNANAVGYYRTQYDGATLQKLGTVAMTELSAAERTSLINDESALMAANKESIDVFLDLVAVMKQDQERSVFESYSGSLQSINDYLVTAQDRDAFHAWVRSNFRPMMEKIGWTASASEKGDTPRLRADLIEILGGVGEDPQTIQQATRWAEQYLADPNSVDPTIIRAVLGVAAHNGNAALFDKYLAALRKINSPEQFRNIAYTLSSFRSPELVQRWLDVTVSDEVRNQDAPHLIASVLIIRENQAVAWTWVKAHWPEVEKKITMSSGLDIIGATRTFCDAESRDDMQKFFTEHKVPSAERTLKLAAEGIDSCIHYRDHQQNNLAVWLGRHAATSEAGTH